ncbi:MAG: choice-of-anchor tandem repeat GloVer-containing protein, partial [Prosthecobacter sp.]
MTATTIYIQPINDTLDEGMQDVICQLRSTRTYVISGTGLGTVNITDDDDPQFFVKLTNSGVEEPATTGTSTAITFEINRPASGAAITVNYAISGTATAGTDYTALPGSIAFAAGDTTKTINVLALPDSLMENAETVILTLLPGAGYTLMASQVPSAVGYILDQDQPTVDVTENNSTFFNTVTETSSSLSFVVSREVSTASPLTVNYTMSGTATSGTDYTGATGSVTIAANSTQASVTLLLVNDTIPEGTESIIITLTPTPGTYGVRLDSATIWLGDNDSYPSGTVGFSGATSSVNETAGTAAIPVVITGTPAGTVTVRYRVNGGTATGSGYDFTLPEGTLTFAPGETSKNINVAILPDTYPETAETVVLQLFNATGGNLGSSAHTVTINNLSMPEAFTDLATTVLATSATLNGHVLPNGIATNVWFEYGGTSNYGASTAPQAVGSGTTSVNVTAPVSGLTLPGYHFRCVAQNSAGTTYGQDQVFGTDSTPVASTLAASNVGGTYATLNGTANSNSQSGTAWFEYGLTTAYGTSTSTQALAASAADIAVAQSITGLTPSSVYYYRLNVQTPVGLVQGPNMSFTTPTPPVVITGSFTGVGQTGFTCDGSVNPGGDAASVWFFQYGTDTSYGSQTTPQSTGSGTTSILVHGTASGLTPATTYHLRLAVTNSFGTTFGHDQIVTTLPVASPTATLQPQFQYTNTGTAPQAGLVLGSDGAFYGTTSTGGTADYGTVFKLTANGMMTTLTHFYDNGNGTTSGSSPQSDLVQGSNGSFYGTTYDGGSNGNGCVFVITPDGTTTNLVNFTYSGTYAGSLPQSGLTLGPDGSFYGVTRSGGSGGFGTVFKVTEAGAFTSLLTFTGTTGGFLGSAPRANLTLGADGNFYGTTSTGGSGGGFGTLFKVTTAGVLTTLVNFTGTTGDSLGSAPLGALVQAGDGTLYGMTSTGGTGNFGTVFKVTTDGVLTTLVNFTGTSGAAMGAAPKGALKFGVGDTLYGTTQTGGPANLGTVFQVTTAGVFTTLVNFTGTSGGSLGSSPNGSLISDAGGSFYGTTSGGGLNGFGCVFKVTAAGEMTTVASFTAAPQIGRLVQGSNGSLYGTTSRSGGALGIGMAFSILPGGAPTTLASLAPTSGTTAINSNGGMIR